MKIERKHKCERCNKEFNWFYLVPQKNGSGILKAEVIPKDKVWVENVIQDIEKDGYKIPIKVIAHCPHCGQANTIEIE